MKTRTFYFYFFSFLLIFNFFIISKAFAQSSNQSNNLFFTEILKGLGVFKPITDLKIFSFGDKKQNVQNVLEIKTPKADILVKENKNGGEVIVKTKNDTSSIVVDKNTESIKVDSNNSYLSNILEKLGIKNIPQTIPTTAPQNTGQTLPTEINPYLQNGNLNPNSQLGSILNNTSPNGFFGQANSQMGQGGQMFGGGGMGSFIQQIMSGNPAVAVDGFAKQNEGLINKTMQMSTSYAGPGGSIPGDCGIPKGPMAYNIGGKNGSGISCDAKTVFVGYKQELKKGVFGGGYINPLTEKGDNRSGSSSGNCKDSDTAKKYSEGCFSNYSTGAGMAYIQEQLLHFQQQGKAAGQKCVPVDIDNCDSIGTGNYKSILDQVEALNNKGDVKIKVFVKNPQQNGCNFFSHPSVIGAFIEVGSEVTPQIAQKISKMRNKPDQVLLFARGGTGQNSKVQEIEKIKIPNSGYSYDSGSEYEKVNNCTYNP